MTYSDGSALERNVIERIHRTLFALLSPCVDASELRFSVFAAAPLLDSVFEAIFIAAAGTDCESPPHGPHANLQRIAHLEGRPIEI